MDGKLDVDFCLGKSEYCYKDPTHAIYGEVTSAKAGQCKDASVPAKINKLTLGGLAYVGGNNEVVLSALGPFKGLGVQDATLEIDTGDINDAEARSGYRSEEVPY